MESVDQDIENVETPVVEIGAGQLLSEARKNQDKSLDDIAQVLNLSVTQLRAIEQDKPEGLPEPTYVRGYIRAYASLLGLDADDVVSHYQGSHWDQSANLDRLPRGVTDASNDSGHNIGKSIKWIIYIIVFALLAYAFASGMVSQWLGANNTPQEQVEIEQDDKSTSESSDPALNPTINDEVDASLSENSTLISEESSNSETIETTEPTVNPEVQELNEQPANTIEIKFLDTSWIDIRDTNDDRLAYKSFAKGETLSLSSDLPLNVFIGNASGVDVTYNNEPFDISDYQQGVYAKFKLGDKQ